MRVRRKTSFVLVEALSRFSALLADRNLVPRAKARDRIEVAKPGDLVGVRYRLKGRDVIGVRLESLRELMGDAGDRTVDWLIQAGVALEGHGGRTARQLPVRLVVGKKLVTKPRFLILDCKRLASVLRRFESD